MARRRLPAAVAAASMALLAVETTGGAPPSSAQSTSSYTCAGTMAKPGVLAGGTYTSVTVSGACEVNAGAADVSGAVTIDSSSVLLAAFAKNDRTGKGTSSLSAGSISVGSGAALVLGCEAREGDCMDGSSLTSPIETVVGSIVASDALDVIVHRTDIGENVYQTGGGGGYTCLPQNNPPFSDYEDNTIGGYMWISGLQSCWLGALRNTIGGSLTELDNKMADPDAMEVEANTIAGDLICAGDSPANQYGDSGSTPDVVSGYAVGQCAFGLDKPDPKPTPVAVSSTHPAGYWLGASDGGVFSFGAPFYGSASGVVPSTTTAVGIAATPGGGGYCLATGTAQVFPFGHELEGCQAVSGTLNKPVVGTSALPQGGGSYLVAADGGIFTSGLAPFYGSTGNIVLNKPAVGMAVSPMGDGYWIVAADGGVFSFGPGAAFHGSTGGITLNQPVVGMATDPVTGGYWLVAKDGGVFSFDAPFYGSLGDIHLNAPIVGIAASPTGNGYYLVGSDGGVFAFGPGAHFQGSTGGIKLAKPVVGLALG